MPPYASAITRFSTNSSSRSAEAPHSPQAGESGEALDLRLPCVQKELGVGSAIQAL